MVLQAEITAGVPREIRNFLLSMDFYFGNNFEESFLCLAFSVSIRVPVPFGRSDTNTGACRSNIKALHAGKIAKMSQCYRVGQS